MLIVSAPGFTLSSFFLDLQKMKTHFSNLYSSHLSKDSIKLIKNEAKKQKSSK